MPVITRTYFDSPEYTATYDYDDQLLKLLAVHVDNRLADTLGLDVLFAADNGVVLVIDASPGHTDVPIPVNQQPDVSVDDRGRVTNVYARTV